MAIGDREVQVKASSAGFDQAFIKIALLKYHSISYQYST